MVLNPTFTFYIGYFTFYIQKKPFEPYLQILEVKIAGKHSGNFYYLQILGWEEEGNVECKM